MTYLERTVKKSYVVGLLVFFLVIVPIAVMIFLCWYCFCRDRHQRSMFWAKIHGPSKQSLPCVHPSAFQFPKVLPPPHPPHPSWIPSLKSVSFPQPHPARLSHPRHPSGPSIASLESRLLNESMQKSDDVHEEVLTVKSLPRKKLKSFGVASERLITQIIEISPAASPPILLTPSPKASSKNPLGEAPGKRDFRTWMKDRLHLQLPSLRGSASSSTSPSPCTPPSGYTDDGDPGSPPLPFAFSSSLPLPPPPPPQSAKPSLK